jgi:hypothetical protein
MAAPERTEAMIVRRAAVNEIWRGVNGLPGVASSAERDGNRRGGAGGGAGQFDGGHPGGMLLGDQGRGRPAQQLRSMIHNRHGVNTGQ